ncbi:hypothetical protein ACFU7T_09935 [Streptomyces sp. NPDC057555]|uniref:effector-associated constant component EACC1 n=1 Tax=Streptomyces sp. NPDC057555 TaxID=3346166 RepID=UPI0036BED73E
MAVAFPVGAAGITERSRVRGKRLSGLRLSVTGDDSIDELTDLADWLRHEPELREETADTYGHLTPDSTGRAVKVMDLALTRHRADLVLT